MRIAIWHSEHEISKTVCAAVKEGIPDADLISAVGDNWPFIKQYDFHIGYGILRGVGDIFHQCTKRNIAWAEIDNGYWKPGHYNGYYRISLNGTQQTTELDNLLPDYDRWDALGIEVLPSVSRTGQVLVCPPTDHVCRFFNSNPWHNHGYKLWRDKSCNRLLQDDIDACSKVRTFNSSVGWEALRQGIPVVSDATHSIVGAFAKTLDDTQLMDIDNRRRLFAIMASLQFTLAEIRQGLLWQLIQKLLMCSSVGIQERSSPQKFVPIQSLEIQNIPSNSIISSTAT